MIKQTAKNKKRGSRLNFVKTMTKEYKYNMNTLYYNMAVSIHIKKLMFTLFYKNELCFRSEF